jgi:hypothetical protein
MSTSVCFIPGQLQQAPGPLSRFLPPVLSGAVTGWLQGRLPQGSWLIDPFGASPGPAVEAARLGYRVLAAVNNPIARFLLEMHANPPLESELRAALAALGAAQKGDERIEPHLRGLYATRCASCDREVEAKAFIWERGAQAPSGRIYNCPQCGEAGERLASQHDARHAAQFSAQTPSGSLHLARALERVAPLEDPDRVYAKEALETYLPRAVYALLTLVNKLDALPEQQRKLTCALLLAAFDQSNTLWAYPAARERPRVLNVPARFREVNVWLALEEAVETWPSRAEGESYAHLPLVTWPELPPESGGISVFEGRLKDLADHIEGRQTARIDIAAVLTALPRPNQAFWTLSALWSGWLWGHGAAASFKGVLRRRRYDWAWHTTALYANCKNLGRLLRRETPFFGMLPEIEPGFLSAALVACELAGFDLVGVALREEDEQAQIHWRNTPGAAGQSPSVQDQDMVEQAMMAHLRARGEPASYLHLHGAALTALAQAHRLVSPSKLPPAEAPSQVQAHIQKGLSESGLFRRYAGSARSVESGRWWLAANVEDTGQGILEESLSDRIEMAVVRYLVSHPTCTFEEIETALCKELCGLLTPEREIIAACLESYGNPLEPGAQVWQLRDQDTPRARREDLKSMRTLLFKMGERLGYRLSPPQEPPEIEGDISPLIPLGWEEEHGKPAYLFYVLASAVLGRIIFPGEHVQTTSPPSQRWIVLPGGRAGLVRYKLARDPRLAEALGQGWEFIKFRHLRRLSEAASLTPENIRERLMLDPLANEDPQMSLW